MSGRAWGELGAAGHVPGPLDPHGGPDPLERCDPAYHIGRVDHPVENHARYCFPRNLRSDP